MLLPLLALPSMNGALIVSLAKKGKGRPVGIKNKPKLEHVQPKKMRVISSGRNSKEAVSQGFYWFGYGHCVR